MDDRQDHEPEKDAPPAAPAPPNLRSAEELAEEAELLISEEERQARRIGRSPAVRSQFVGLQIEDRGLRRLDRRI